MSYAQHIPGSCLAVQQSLLEISGVNSPASKRSHYGAIQAMVDPYNTEGFKQIQIGGGQGKNQPVEVYWRQRLGVDDVITEDFGDEGLCGTCEHEHRQGEIYRVTRIARAKCFEIDANKHREICNQSYLEELNEKIPLAFDAILQRIDQDAVAYLLANAGQYADGSASKTFNFLNTTPSSADPSGQIELADEFRQFGLGSRPLLVGGGIIAKHYDYLGIGCCNQEGVDMSRLAGRMPFFVDYNLGQSTSPAGDVFVAWEPGTVQLLERLDNVGQYAHDWGFVGWGSLKTVVVDPVSSISFDVSIVADACRSVHKVHVYKRYDFWSQPLDAFRPSDPLNGVNFVLKGVATQS